MPSKAISTGTKKAVKIALRMTKASQYCLLGLLIDMMNHLFLVSFIISLAILFYILDELVKVGTRVNPDGNASEKLGCCISSSEFEESISRSI